MKERVAAAFESVRNNFSVDRVLADPDLNAVFVKACAEHGLTASPATLNRSLISLRKAGKLRQLKSKRTSFNDEDSYRFAAEMAVRFMERRDGVTLDDVICDPALAAEFDKLAAAISPGFSALQYRWAALNLRKTNRLAPELLARVAPPRLVMTSPVGQLEIESIPREQGLYIFYAADSCLYVGEAENLRNRLGKHLDHSDNKGLAHWMWQQGTDQLFVELQALDPMTTQKVRRALERELIRSRHPTFNVQR